MIKTLSICMSVGFLFAGAAKAQDWKGDYEKIYKDERATQLTKDWCGGTAKVACQNRTSCEIIIDNSQCGNVELYLDDNGFRRIANESYQASLPLYRPLFDDDYYAGRIYLDLGKAKTFGSGRDKQQYINILLRNADGSKYQKLSANFKN